MRKPYTRVPLKGPRAIVFKQIQELTTKNMLLSTDELAAELEQNHRLGKDVEVTPFWLAGEIDKLEELGYIGAAVKRVTEEGREKEIMVFYERTQGKRLEDEHIVSELYEFSSLEPLRGLCEEHAGRIISSRPEQER